MSYSDTMQKASARAVAAMLRRGRIEGGASQLNLQADVLDAIAVRIETAEARKRAGGDPLHHIEQLLKVCPGGAIKDAATAFLQGKATK